MSTEASTPPHQAASPLVPGEPDAQPQTASPRRPPPRARRIIIQLLGFAIGLGLLAWCASQAAGAKNREQLQHLLDAPRWILAAVAGLSFLTVLINGLIFHLLLAPARRIPPADAIAVNAIATFLNYLPFKLSVASRFVLHHKRNHVPLLTIAAWMVAVGVSTMAVLVPAAAVTILRGRVDAAWAALAAASIFACVAALCAFARVFSHEQGLARLHAIADRIPIALAGRLARSHAFRHLHAGFAMLSAPRFLAAISLLRCLDIAVQAVRFVLVSRAVDAPIAWDQAIILATVYFLLGVLSPAGALGTPQGGTAAIGQSLKLPAASVLSIVTLAIGAVEALTNLLFASLAVLYLRPDRLLRTQRHTHPSEELGAQPRTPSESKGREPSKSSAP